VLVAAAVCPHPPLLVPGVAAGATGETDDLRAACDAAVAAMVATGPDVVVVVGSADRTGPFEAGAWGSLRAYGAAVDVARSHAGGADGRGTGPTLPLSLTLGRWLLDRAPSTGAEAPALLFGVAADADRDRCLEVGAALAGRAARVGLLVMGDGTGRRTPKPGYLDGRAEPFDARVAAALSAGDPSALAGIDVALADELLVQGRAAWQVLAGAAGDRRWQGDVSYDAAPYGVGYLVATWLPG
jgi:hypothetical protein